MGYNNNNNKNGIPNCVKRIPSRCAVIVSYFLLTRKGVSMQGVRVREHSVDFTEEFTVFFETVNVTKCMTWEMMVLFDYQNIIYCSN